MLTKGKKKAIIGSVIAAVLLIVMITIIIVVAVQPDMMSISPVMRDLYRKRFEKTELYSDNGSVELVREISPSKPLNLITFYGGSDTVEELWATVPEDIREISVVNYIPGNFFKPDSGDVKRVLDFADKCDEAGIPYSVQVINGETHYEWQVPLKWIEENFCSRPYFYGLNAAELYNGEEWRGQLDGDVALYYNNSIRLMAKYGRFFFWTDTNIFGTNGTVVDWIEENEFLYDTLKACYRNVIMQNKESYGDPSSYSIMKGLYMAKLIGGYGVATDWWHWQVDGKKALFDKKPDNIDSEFERIFYYPENMQIMSLAMVAANGGFCFKNEAEYYSVAVKDGDEPYRRTATFGYATIPFLRDVLNGRIVIPTREELLENEKFAVVGGKNYEAINYNLKESNLYPNTPLYNIIPLLPANIKADEKAYFDNYDVKLINEKLDEDKVSQFVNTGMDGNTYFTGIAGQWVYINNMENKDVIKEAKATKLFYDGISDLTISATPHTYVSVLEDSLGMVFTMNNLRLDKEEMTKSLDKNMSPQSALYEWVGVNENGDVKADMSRMRTTKISFRTDDGKKPELTLLVDENDKHINNFKVSDVTSSGNGVWTITVEHNGYVAFRINTASRNKLSQIKQDITNYSIATYDNFDLNIYGTDTAMTYDSLQIMLDEYKDIIGNYNNYTEISYHAFIRQYSYIESAIKYKNVSGKDINEAVKKMKNVKLIDISDEVELVNSIDTSSLSPEEAVLYDKLLYALLSPTKHYDAKDHNLQVSIFYKRKNYNDSVYRMKVNEINDCYEELSKLLG